MDIARRVVAAVLILVFWGTCGYINYGYTLGFFTHKYPYMDNTGIAYFTAVAGPFGTPATLIIDRPLHWKTKPLTTEERWEEFKKRGWGELGREYFEKHFN